MPPAA